MDKPGRAKGVSDEWPVLDLTMVREEQDHCVVPAKTSNGPRTDRPV
jgi:hypothetical protein